MFKRIVLVLVVLLFGKTPSGLGPAAVVPAHADCAQIAGRPAERHLKYFLKVIACWPG